MNSELYFIVAAHVRTQISSLHITWLNHKLGIISFTATGEVSPNNIRNGLEMGIENSML